MSRKCLSLDILECVRKYRGRIDAAERGCVGKTRSLTPYSLTVGGETEEGNQSGGEWAVKPS